MLPYNTQQEKLTLPEYGRLVHDLIKICMEIEDRDERNAFAETIVNTMKSMIHDQSKVADDRKYWDHLYIISEGKLDIDSPFGKPEMETLNLSPKKIPYSGSDFSRRHYGRIIQKMVHEMATMPNSAEKDAGVELLATHIKKLLVMNQVENADDAKVFEDLAALSSGAIVVEEGIFDLPEYQEEKPQKQQKRKKNNNRQ